MRLETHNRPAERTRGHRECQRRSSIIGGKETIVITIKIEDGGEDGWRIASFYERETGEQVQEEKTWNGKEYSL